MTIEEQFQQYKDVFPPNMPEHIEKALKNTFYAGCIVMFERMREISQNVSSEEDVAQAMAQVSEIDGELKGFMATQVILGDIVH